MTTAVKRPDRAEVRDAIYALEDALLQMPQTDCPVQHHFAPGLYGRELFIPEHVTITGYIHKTEHLSILLSGTLLMTNGEGEPVELTGPRVEIAKPGTKRVAYAMTDSRFLTVHATDETDVKTLEATLVTNDFSEVEHLVDQQDYALLAIEKGITEDYIESLKQIPVIGGVIVGLEIRPSPRHGLGLFVKDFVAAGAIIGPALQHGRLMNYSRYTNHSMNPNAKRVIVDTENIDLVAIRDISNEEVTMNYREVLP